MPTDLTPVQRRQQLAEIVARGVLRLLRQRRQDSSKTAAEVFDDPPAPRLNAVLPQMTVALSSYPAASFSAA